MPASATGDAWSVFQYECDGIFDDYGWEWDEASESAFARGDGEQVWCDDVESVRLRVAWADDSALLSVGFWALGYEAEGFWDMMAEATSAPGHDDTGGADDTGEAPVHEDRRGRTIPGETAGCGCATAGTGPCAWLAAMLTLAGIRRRGADPRSPDRP